MSVINFDFVDPATLTGFVREIPFGDLALERLLPSEAVPDTQFRYEVGQLVDVDAAEYRVFDTPAPIADRPGRSRKGGALPPISRKMGLTEEDILRLNYMQTRDASGMIRAIYDDAARVTRAVQVRLELARGEALNTGKLTLNENGVVATVDYGRSSGHNIVLTGSNLWTDTTNSTPITNLRAWHQTYIDDNGIEAGAILMSSTAVNNMLLNAEVRNLVANINGASPNLITRTQLDQVLGSFNLPPIVVVDTKYRVAGTPTRVIPANRVVFVPPTSELDTFGKTLYGVSATAMHLNAIGRLAASAAPGIVAVVLTDEDPVKTWTKSDALAIPLIANPDLTLAATVG